MTRLLCLFCIALLLAGCNTSQQITTVEGLDVLIPPADSLPAGCSPRALDDTAPPFLTTNPMASSDPDFTAPLGGFAFRGDAPADRIEEALMGVYDSNHELGLLAFRFDDADLAQQAGDFLRSNDDAQFVRVEGALLAAAWRDGPDDDCFRALAAHVQALLGTE